MVQMDAGRYQSFADAFLQSINMKPLTQQAYSSTIFFAFIWQQGPGVMGGLLKGLATQPGEMAQMQATEKAVGADLMRDFAKALVDGTIALPSGFEFAALENPEPYIFSQDGQFESGKIPFTVDARLISFIGGSYAVADAARYGVRPLEGGDWGEMPTMVEPKECKVPEEYLAVRFVGTLPKDTLGFPVSATRYKECVVCQALPEQDQSLIGKWQLRQDSLLSYLQKSAEGMDEVRYTTIAGTVYLATDATGHAQWISEGLQIGAALTPSDLIGDIEIDVEANGIVSGRWSTGALAMNFCAESQDMDFTSRVRIPGMDEDVVTTAGPMEDSFLAYECSPKVLTVIYAGPSQVDGPAPTWVLDRVK